MPTVYTSVPRADNPRTAGQYLAASLSGDADLAWPMRLPYILHLVISIAPIYGE
jgi:hypothetical protein